MAATRRMQPSDIPSVVSIHLSSFEGFFLSFLGRAFLRELYAGILEDPSGIAFVAEDAEKILGFVAGTSNPRGFYKRLLLKRWWRFAIASIRPVLSDLSIIPRLLRAFSRGEEVDIHENYANLMSIAVLPKMQRTGVGELLIEAFLDEAVIRGVDGVNLTTDKNENEKVNRFYQKLGFQLSSQFCTPEGREMNEYAIRFDHL